MQWSIIDILITELEFPKTPLRFNDSKDSEYRKAVLHMAIAYYGEQIHIKIRKRSVGQVQVPVILSQWSL